VEAELFHADRRTDTAKVTAAFRNFWRDRETSLGQQAPYAVITLHRNTAPPPHTHTRFRRFNLRKCPETNISKCVTSLFKLTTKGWDCAYKFRRSTLRQE
jgi:hypothetical protein